MACRMLASMSQCGQQFATPAGSVCVCLCGSFRHPTTRTRLSTRNPRFSPAKLSQLKLGTFPRWLRTHDSHSRIATQRFNFGPLPRCLFIGLSRFIISDGKRRLNLSPAKQPNSQTASTITETHIKSQRLLVFNYAVFSAGITYKIK